MLVIDIEGTNDKMKRMINVYRSFNLINCTARELFTGQLDIIKNAFNCDTLLISDFNLNYNRTFDVDYCNANLFEEFDLRLEFLDLVQLVNFDTWSRLVGTNVRSSCLDHIYVKNVHFVSKLTHLTPCFGDHKLIMIDLYFARPPPRISVGRNWSRCSPEALNSELSRVDWSNEATDVQGA